MKVSMILAVDQNGLIGCSNNTLPWSDKEDMAWFKKNTLDKAVLMGKNTWLSIGKPLPKRSNFVLSKTEVMDPIWFTVTVDSFNKAINLAKYFGRDELVIIGGKQVYESLVHKVDRIILTVIPGEHEGDVFVDIPIIDLLRCHVPLFSDLETALEQFPLWDLVHDEVSESTGNHYIIIERKEQRTY